MVIYCVLLLQLLDKVKISLSLMLQVVLLAIGILFAVPLLIWKTNKQQRHDVIDKFKLNS